MNGSKMIMKENMNIAILGNTSFSQNLYQKALKSEVVNSAKIITLDQQAQEGSDNTDVITIFAAYHKFRNRIDYILVPSLIDDDTDILSLIQKLKDLGFESEKLLIVPVEILLGVDDFDIKKCLHIDKYNYLDYLEISINDFCNLNCKGCSHFCNLVKDRQFPDFTNYRRDFLQLKKLISHIFKIRIMGGEPFLNPELPKYVTMIREVYAFSDLRICTNATLILKQKEDVFNVIRENKVMLDISVYPPLFNQMDKIIQKLQSLQVAYNYEIITRFKPILLGEKSSYPFKALTECNSLNLKDGYLAPCPVVLNIDYYNKEFDTDYPNTGGKVDIFKKGLKSEEIIKELKKPFDLCNHCSHYRDNLSFFKWKNSSNNINKNDWIMEEDKWH